MRAVVTVFVLWLAGLGSAAQFGKLSVAFDLMALRYPEQGAAGIGLIVSILGIVGLVFGTTAGLLVARIGPRRAIVAAMLLGALVSALQTLPLPYALLILTRVLEGVSHLSIVVVGPTMIAGIATGRYQGLAMTLWSSFFGVTYALLALIAPSLLAGGSVAPLFLGHAVWMGGLALVLAVLLPADPAAPPLPSFMGLIRQHGTIYASPSIAAPAMGFVFYTALYVALLTLLPPLLPPGDRAIAAAGMPLVSIVLSLTLGVWGLRYISAVRMVQVGYAAGLVAALLLLAGWGQGMVTLVAAFALSGAMGIVQGASFASIPQLNLTAETRAMASGAVAQLGNVGTTLGTPILALLIAAMGPMGVVAFAAPLCIAGIAAHAVQARRRRLG